MFNSYKIIDLTHTLHKNIPGWERSCGFSIKALSNVKQHGIYLASLSMDKSGVGTHIDAPIHYIEGGKDISELELNNLLLPIHVIDISTKAHENYELSLEDIEEYETRFERIKSNSLVIMNSGWSEYWNDIKKYRNEDAHGNMHFPTISSGAAKFLVERDIAGIGVDTLSPDKDLSFPVHKIILGAGKYIIENIANSSNLPPQGGYAIALPLKLKEAPESPIRIIGLIPKK